MRIVIFGTGGVGGFFGGRLARAGEDVTFIARGEHLRAIKANGLKVDSPEGDFLINPAKATDDVDELGETDLVILGVKAWQVPEAARDKAARRIKYDGASSAKWCRCCAAARQ